MTGQFGGFQSPLATEIRQFLDHKRALARKFVVEEKSLRLLDRYLVEHDVQTREQITPDLLDAFLVSRPRTTPRSYNHLLGTVARLFNWLVAQGLLERSPLRAKPRRQTAQRIPFLFDRTTAGQLLEAAGSLAGQLAGSDARADLSHDLCPAVRARAPGRRGRPALSGGC